MAAKKQISELRQQVAAALAAAEGKKAEQISILELDKNAGGFTDYFVICSGSNPRQVQAIADEVELRLKKVGQHPLNVEGYKQAEWVLLDYVDFVVHIFSDKARSFYDLERLWKSAKRLELSEVKAPKKRVAAPAQATVKAAAKKAAKKTVAKTVTKTAAKAPAKAATRAKARKKPSA